MDASNGVVVLDASREFRKSAEKRCMDDSLVCLQAYR
jgi:hypothetical protein